ncbi:hypothetical protein AEGHOMDF_6131 [Methylobacterium soli]|nr:hypothetical protein AEGHOMDF_6131 [Methylobacterium soli]
MISSSGATNLRAFMKAFERPESRATWTSTAGPSKFALSARARSATTRASKPSGTLASVGLSPRFSASIARASGPDFGRAKRAACGFGAAGLGLGADLGADLAMRSSVWGRASLRPLSGRRRRWDGGDASGLTRARPWGPWTEGAGAGLQPWIGASCLWNALRRR